MTASRTATSSARRTPRRRGRAELVDRPAGCEPSISMLPRAALQHAVLQHVRHPALEGHERVELLAERAAARVAEAAEIRLLRRPHERKRLLDGGAAGSR